MNKTFITQVEGVSIADNLGQYFLLSLAWPKLDIKPGQFVRLESLCPEKIFMRPFSVFNVGGDWITLLVKIVGENTKRYSRLKMYDTLKISGPCGKPFVFDKKIGNYILVGGGSGLGALGLFAKHLKNNRKKVEVLIGFRNQEEKILADLFAGSHIPVESIAENGDKKTCGPVTMLLEEKIRNDQGKSTVIACGPKAMLKCVRDLCEHYGNKCFLNWEEMMACGTGTCKGCAVFDKDGKAKLTCKDGPFFEAGKLDIRILPPPPSIKPSKKTDYPFRIVLKGQAGTKLELEYPILTGSGCFDVESDEDQSVLLNCIGGIIEKGISLKPREGNPSPRICEVPYGMINAIGLQNTAVTGFIKTKLPLLRKFKKPVIANIFGSEKREFIKIAKRLKNTNIDGAELNVSCPNVKKGGMFFGYDPTVTFDLTHAVRGILNDIFLIVKLPPGSTNTNQVISACYDAGADAISLINTLPGMEIDVETRRPKIANNFGGISGPLLRPYGVKLIHQARSLPFKINLIGGGGIRNGNDALQYFLAGANAVFVGTELFSNPFAAKDIIDFAEKYLERHKLNHIQDLVGKIVLY